MTDTADNLAELERRKVVVRERARHAIGVTGETGDTQPPLRDVLQRHGIGVYPLVAVGVLGVTDLLPAYAFAVLAPDISGALGIGRSLIAATVALKTLAFALAPLPVAALAQRGTRRATICIVTALTWSVVAGATAFTVTVWGLAFVLLADGVSSGSVAALHQPLLLDTYPADGRVRVLSGYQAFTAAGRIMAPLLVALLAGPFGFSWRGVFLGVALVSMCGVLFATRLRDPGVGRWDTNEIRASVRRRRPTDGDVGHAEPTTEAVVTLRFFEIVRRLMLIPTVRRVLAAFGVFGVLVIPFQTFLFFFLEERWSVGPSGRGLFFAFTAAVSLVALALFGPSGERRFRADPGSMLRMAGLLLAAAVVLIGLAGVSPWFGATVALFAAAEAMLAILGPAMNAALLAVVPSHMRPHTSALAGIFFGGVGGIAGALFLSGIDRRFGVGGAMVALVVPGVLGALILATAGHLVGPDIDRMIDEIIEDEEIRRIRSTGGRLPMLACRGIDFSYGNLQVLFDVDFTVDDGEMVALLGVNGAGKSTLLRVISGTALPSRGTVRLQGLEITYLDAERRIRLGMAQVAGGRAVFGPMTVVDNLRSFGYTLGRDAKAVDAAIDRCFERFPNLAERRNQKASTLSGGEQQMLGLSKGVLLRPRVLLIDELTLGLAPVVVGQLLETVRQINATGAAVVLVEQSVNIALRLADHTYFMEKGVIRFDGDGRELSARDDLLRAVFLGPGGRRGRR